MKKATRIGNLEAEILDFVAQSEPLTVGEIAASFGTEKGYARTTVQTVLERLRKKGLLHRDMVDGVFRYRAESTRNEIRSGLVGNFVDQMLGGDVLPIVQYLSDTRNLTPDEAELLRKLVDSMEDSK